MAGLIGAHVLPSCAKQTLKNGNVGTPASLDVSIVLWYAADFQMGSLRLQPDRSKMLIVT